MNSQTENNNAGVELGEYMEILNRRKWYFLVPFALVLAVSTAFALLLPPVYRSEATIMVERQEVPEDLVESTVTGYVQERIQAITKRLMTRDNLWAIIEKYDLYPGERSEGNRMEIVRKMMKSIGIEMVDVQASDPGSGRKGSATIAFMVSFESESPVSARAVANELADLYIKENLRERTEKAAEVSRFLESEVEKLRGEIEEYEKTLATFKQEQQDNLPELRDVNLRLFEKTENEIVRTEETIRSLQESINALSGELAITEPHEAVYNEQGKRLQTGRERLSVLTAEYLALSSKYSQNHPDIIKVRREIEVLGGQSEDFSGIKDMVNELTAQRLKLSGMQQKYGPDHPDIRKLRSSITALEKGIRNASISGVADNASLATAPDNPRYIALKSQLDGAKIDLSASKARLAQLQSKLSEYERRLFQTPIVERDYKALSRDYSNAQKKYAQLKEKLLDARISEKLESDTKAERFTILQPAYLPSLPESPNRIGIALLGVFLGFGGGLVSVAVAEYQDKTIRGRKGLMDVMRAPPLAVIPEISGDQGHDSEMDISSTGDDRDQNRAA